MDKNHKDPDTIDLEAPRLAQYMHKAWKTHQNIVYWVDINLALTKRIEVLSNTIERCHSSRNTPSLLYSESCFEWKLEKSHTRRYMNHLDRLRRFPWNMTGWKSWLQKLLDNQREKLFNKPKVSNQANQIQTQIMIERRNPFIRPQRGASCSQEFETRCFREEAVKHDRKGKPLFAVTQVTEQGHHYRFVESTRSASYSECDDDKAWSSQEWKSDELMDDGTVKPVLCPQRGAPAIRHWGRRNRIRFVVGIQIILE